MDANTIFATGGASGVVGVIGFLLYRFLFTKHRIASKCCGKEFTVDVEGNTPKVFPVDKN